MSAPDINLLSFNGPESNGRIMEMSDTLLDGSGYSDTVKCSTGLANFCADFGDVLSGSEDALDVNNRCEHLMLSAKKWLLRGRMGITIKGGSHHISVSGTIAGHGKETDVDLGNHSDQSREPTRNVTLNLRRADGAPIRVRVLNADTPTFIAESGPYTYVFPSPKLGPLHTLIVWGFVTFHRFFS